MSNRPMPRAEHRGSRIRSAGRVRPVEGSMRPAPRLAFRLMLLLPLTALAVDPPLLPAEAPAETGAQAEPSARPTEQVSAKILRYVRRVIERHDRNGDGRLEADEFRSMKGDPRRADLDQDGVITFEELAQRVASYGRRRRIRLRTPNPAAVFVFPLLRSSEPPAAAEPPKGSVAEKKQESERRFYVPRALLPQGLPDWFSDRDTDGDGQLTFAEFSRGATRAEIDRFGQYDQNGDGILTARELQRGLQRLEQDQPAPPDGGDQRGASAAPAKTNRVRNVAQQ